ncbi:uncharacterized protein LOC131151298 [Malania oleifera]|uniref:uncharacterized protein LOC131151298 n=1 Tax=Malania oleifera TaxID=397392 RepID=UPI0025ADD3D5|nr:uncharacterized protein LOC131151298 [Malania oleifera]
MRRNHIASVMRSNGKPTSSLQQIADEFLEFYKGLLATEEVCTDVDPLVVAKGQILSDNHLVQMVRDIEDEDIKEALFSIVEDKSPGPDGFTSCFFKKAWGAIGKDFTHAVKEFFVKGRMLKQINHAINTLIAISNHASTVQDFRPISCCNVIYKVISKIMVSRIRPCLDYLVNPAQSAFIGQRSMIDNVYLVQELVRKYGRKWISPRCKLKVDLRKAYDTISWKFLEGMLEKLNFPSIMINWIMQCVTTTSFSISFNGGYHGFFKGRRGIRQGDPLSPLLFVLCLEYLSRLLMSLEEKDEFKFHPKCGRLKITHLDFSDDLNFFSRGDLTSVKSILECLDKFSACFGLKANCSKSNVYTAGMRGADLEDIREAIGFAVGEFPFRYLGIPFASTRLNSAQYGSLVNKIASLFGSWPGNLISYTGKLELISSVIQGVECFWLAIFPLPKAVLGHIVKLCRSFL